MAVTATAVFQARAWYHEIWFSIAGEGKLAGVQVARTLDMDM